MLWVGDAGPFIGVAISLITRFSTIAKGALSSSDVLYITALAARFTVNTMPEGTLKALADHGELGTILPADGGECEDVLAQFAKAGINVDALAAQLQDKGGSRLSRHGTIFWRSSLRRAPRWRRRVSHSEAA